MNKKKTNAKKNKKSSKSATGGTVSVDAVDAISSARPILDENRIDGTPGSTIEDFLKGIPPSGDGLNNVNQWNTFVATSVPHASKKNVVDETVLAQKSKYDGAKIRAVKDILDVLASNAKLCSLIDLVPDPVSPGTKTFRLFLLVRGVKTAAKKTLLNSVLMTWAHKHRKIGFELDDPLGVYQPGTTDTQVKMFFKVLNDNGTTITHSEMKGITGSYWKYFEELYRKTREVRPDFGTRPNRAAVDLKADWKIRNLADPPYRPFEVYNDLLHLSIFNGGKSVYGRTNEVCANSVSFFSVFYFIESYLLITFFCHLVLFPPLSDQQFEIR